MEQKQMVRKFGPDRLELEKIDYRLNPELAAAFVFVLLTAALAALDFYSHPNGGIADLERRKAIAEISQFLAKHIGNFGFAAATVITAVFAKHIGLFITQGKKFASEVVRHGFKATLAVLMAGSALVETFSGNTELLGDMGMVLLAIGLALPAAELAIQSYKTARTKKKLALE